MSRLLIYNRVMKARALGWVVAALAVACGGDDDAPGGDAAAAVGSVSGDVGVLGLPDGEPGDLYVGLKAQGDCSHDGELVVHVKRPDRERQGEGWGTGYSIEDVPVGSYVAYGFFDADDSSEGDASPNPTAGDWVPTDGGAGVECAEVTVAAGADTGAVIVELDGAL
jgi:hypothetical protein